MNHPLCHRLQILVSNPWSHLIGTLLATVLLASVCEAQTTATKSVASSAAWDRIATHFSPPAEFENSFGEYASLLKTATVDVATAEQWSKRRAEIVQSWLEYLGPLPPDIPHPRVDRLKSIERSDGIEQTRLRIEIAAGQTGEGWLMVPPGKGPFPAVLVVFYEPETSIGVNQEKQFRDFGLQLAQRGFVTLNIGTPGGDARKPDIGTAKCQPLLFHAHVAANCFNVLADLPNVDAKRIGIVGHSYGGKWSLFAGAFYERFAAVAVSDPGIVFDETRPSVNYWEPWYLGMSDTEPVRKPGVITASSPRTGAYAKLVADHHDLHEVQSLIAPRPYLVSGGSEDPPKRWQPLNRVREVYRLLGREHFVGMTNRPDHSPNAESNAVIFDFFEHFLKSLPSTASAK